MSNLIINIYGSVNGVRVLLLKTLKSKQWASRFAIIGVVIVVLVVFVIGSGLLRGAGVIHDNIQIGLPLRTLISSAYHNQIFPFWDHWAMGGNPISSIYIATAFSPIIFVISLFTVYSIDAYIFEIIVTFLLGFAGTYLWLRDRHTEAISLFGATAYSLSAYFIVQYPMSFSSGVSGAMYPWFALGLTYALNRKIKGIGIISLTMLMQFTTGYLGVNIICLQFISLYCLCSYWQTREKFWSFTKEDLIGIGYALAGLCLFLLMFNFILFETFSNLSLDYFTQRKVSPFTAATSANSAYTFFVPNHISPFVRRGVGQPGIFYVGLLTVFFALSALWGVLSDKRVPLLLAVGLLAYFSLLTEDIVIARFLVDVIPFYDKVRYHGWNVILVLFFFIELAMIGVSKFHQLDNKRVILTWLGFFLLAYFAILTADGGPYTLPKLMGLQQFWLVPFLVIILSKKVKLKWNTKIFVCILLLLVDLGNVQRDYVRLVKTSNLNRDTILANYKKQTEPGFPPPERLKRRESIRAEMPLVDGVDQSNLQYLDKEPVFNGYLPQAHPTMIKVANTRRFKWRLKNIFFLASSGADTLKADQKYMEVQFLKMDPESLEASFKLTKSATVVWSSAYSKNWELTVDGKKAEYKRSKIGLMSFQLPAGESHIVFSYKPWYFGYSIGLFAIALMLSLLSFMPKRKAKLV
ncbi:MAG: YfhO family protein [SAR324 cluster bacterium]|nr:YfhO family protein [SAR324 cluster bacterium]